MSFKECGNNWYETGRLFLMVGAANVKKATAQISLIVHKKT